MKNLTDLLALDSVGVPYVTYQFSWIGLIPQPDHLIQWLFNIGVASTLISLNVVKLRDHFRNKKNTTKQ